MGEKIETDAGSAPGAAAPGTTGPGPIHGDPGCGCSGDPALPECRKTVRPSDLKRALDARLARIEGQVRGIRRMISEDAYCDDVLAQVSAARSALDRTALAVLEHHMKHCLIDRVRAGQDEIVDELVESLSRML
ncbi:MAG: metal-sensing transcriptional repressor [Treponema sp.]|nr:metal-sensing transcriptional repressor [Treponema sp.]